MRDSSKEEAVVGNGESASLENGAHSDSSPSEDSVCMHCGLSAAEHDPEIPCPGDCGRESVTDGDVTAPSTPVRTEVEVPQAVTSTDATDASNEAAPAISSKQRCTVNFGRVLYCMYHV